MQFGLLNRGKRDGRCALHVWGEENYKKFLVGRNEVQSLIERARRRWKLEHV